MMNKIVMMISTYDEVNVWVLIFPPQSPINFKLKLDINFTRPSDRLDCARVTSVKALSARVIGFSGTWRVTGFESIFMQMGR